MVIHHQWVVYHQQHHNYCCRRHIRLHWERQVHHLVCVISQFVLLKLWMHKTLFLSLSNCSLKMIDNCSNSIIILICAFLRSFLTVISSCKSKTSSFQYNKCGRTASATSVSCTGGSYIQTNIRLGYHSGQLHNTASFVNKHTTDWFIFWTIERLGGGSGCSARMAAQKSKWFHSTSKSGRFKFKQSIAKRIRNFTAWKCCVQSGPIGDQTLYIVGQFDWSLWIIQRTLSSGMHPFVISIRSNRRAAFRFLVIFTTLFFNEFKR